jgi:hypothetical protein
VTDDRLDTSITQAIPKELRQEVSIRRLWAKQEIFATLL